MAIEVDIDTLSFEEAYAQMQGIVTQLEGGDIALETAIATFERGMLLAQRCNALLAQAQLRVQTLEEAADGTITLADADIVTE